MMSGAGERPARGMRTPHCRPVAIVLTAGRAADSPQFFPVLNNVRVRLPVSRPRARPTAVVGDKDAASRRSSRRRRTWSPAAARRAVGAVGLSPMAPISTATATRLNAPQRDEGLARHRHPLWQSSKSYLAGLRLSARPTWICSLL